MASLLIVVFAVRELRHHSLVAWQRADDLFIKVHTIAIKSFPTYERFELGSQVRRAAYSVAANIVEGFARRSGRERLHFLNIAEGSLAEVGYCLHAACRLGYIDAGTLSDLENDLAGVGKPLGGLIKSTRAMAVAAPIGALLCAIAIGYWLSLQTFLPV